MRARRRGGGRVGVGEGLRARGREGLQGRGATMVGGRVLCGEPPRLGRFYNRGSLAREAEGGGRFGWL
ncbi:unnamed protein product [Dovyalis caffra]|uniref:Uncharacterized protein n=1 Tax=Dovyalis caffra TaxID=77055 RepID=A0AAV1RFY7_9ROSI|nr:unnamed protein product [Dovyalis caffra]